MSIVLVLLVTGLQAGVVDLTPGQDPDAPLRSAYVMVDYTSILTLDDVRRIPHAFERNRSGFINPGTTSGVVWVRFDVRNTSAEAGQWVVAMNRALVDPGAIYLISERGTRTLLANSTEAYARSYVEFGTLAGRFELPPMASASLYIRYRGGNWSGLIPSITTEATLQRMVTRDLLVIFALIGGVLTLVLYVSVSFLLLDRQVVFLYALAQLAWLAFYLHFSGVTTVYLWPQQPHAGRLVSPVTVSISILAILQFARHFLVTRARLPRIDVFLRALMVALAVALGMLAVADWQGVLPRGLPLFAIYVVTTVAWLTVVPLALFATVRWDRDYWPLTVSWSLLLAFFLIMLMVWTGRLDAVPLQQHVYGVFIYAEAVFMALGIALRIRRMRLQRVEAEQRLSRSLAEQLKVTERAVRLAQEREWALEDLAEKGRLILAAGHDTRQMISSLRHYALGLERTSDPERAAQAGRALQQIATSLDDVLGTAIDASGSGGIGDRTLALEAVTPEQIMAPLRLIYGGMAAEKGIDLRLRVAAGDLVTDRVLVARILGNLVSNALKYTDTGRVLVTARRHAGGHRFQVFDTGHGLAPDALRSLLSDDAGRVRFESDADGHGAGMHIVKALAARIGATLDAVSEPGRGSRFELRIPAVPPFRAAPQPFTIAMLDTDPQPSQQLVEGCAELGLRLLPVADPRHLDRSPASEALLVLVDENFGGPHSGLSLARDLARGPAATSVAIMTFDRSIEARMGAVGVCALLLYKPLTPALLLAAAWRAMG
jgi:two-component system, sensor histidine kinase LadS